MRRDVRSARLLGLWTAACLTVLLVAGLLWVGDLTLQWPVLLVPVLWALLALRRGRGRRRGHGDEVPPAPYGRRTDTVERPAIRP